MLHAALSLAAYVGLNAWAVGLIDSGGVEPGTAFATVRVVVDYGLLQPLAYWILTGTGIAWWTWPGLGLAACVALGNSLIQIGVGVALWRWLRRRPTPGARL